ncbi:Hsp20/alpha crystallin family protein [Desulfosudis oleivorans]|uniref:Heat shock protein Hsp20 n=1 Tax=Desulfosudis oleivorans (strain DSM 6200 / JCM 39069 / Hxd3) TaxID=96561 RepID=A8ZX66_DESOH|nr:Hsp20/alpha crystallin family protein [Desulfosudis oleivorans]ABW68445.1 heat shock protein Hsp20 [Desulfosudis oleivorans Hxd3]
MTDKEKKEIQVKEKMEAATPEQTRPGAVFTPAVDIFETDADITLLADMPGVTSKDLTIDLRDNVLTLSGDIAPFENADEQDILIEYEVGKYYRQFTLSDIIDQSRIEAKLNDGVLRLRLPKAEKAQPRKIEISA